MKKTPTLKYGLSAVHALRLASLLVVFFWRFIVAIVKKTPEGGLSGYE
jgi:hypothetical protein